MHLMRSLFLVAHYNLQIIDQHIPGVENKAADVLSSNDVTSFHRQVPAANPEPTTMPL